MSDANRALCQILLGLLLLALILSLALILLTPAPVKGSAAILIIYFCKLAYDQNC